VEEHAGRVDKRDHEKALAVLLLQCPQKSLGPGDGSPKAARISRICLNFVVRPCLLERFNLGFPGLEAELVQSQVPRLALAHAGTDVFCGGGHVC